jgi:hypothetical protein
MAAEQIRRALLAQTGITCWFPRWSLPGAAPSHPECFDEPDSEQEPAQIPEIPANPVLPVASEKPGAPAASSALEMMRSLVDTAEKKPVAPVETPAPPAQSSLNNAAPVNFAAVNVEQVRAEPVGTVESFAFSWFAVDRRLAVLAMLPQGADRLSGSCRQMLTRLIAALHPSLQHVALSEQSFHWPFVDAPDLPADAAAARQAADAFVARRLREQNAALVLLLADEIPWFIAADGKTAAVDSQLIVHPRFGFAMLSTHSLHAMEQSPGLKREAWQALQLVRDRLARSQGS